MLLLQSQTSQNRPGSEQKSTKSLWLSLYYKGDFLNYFAKTHSIIEIKTVFSEEFFANITDRVHCGLN